MWYRNSLRLNWQKLVWRKSQNGNAKGMIWQKLFFKQYLDWEFTNMQRLSQILSHFLLKWQAKKWNLSINFHHYSSKSADEWLHLCQISSSTEKKLEESSLYIIWRGFHPVRSRILWLTESTPLHEAPCTLLHTVWVRTLSHINGQANFFSQHSETSHCVSHLTMYCFHVQIA